MSNRTIFIIELTSSDYTTQVPAFAQAIGVLPDGERPRVALISPGHSEYTSRKYRIFYQNDFIPDHYKYIGYWMAPWGVLGFIFEGPR